MPAPDAGIACTAIYGIVQNSVALGSDFEADVDYVIVVNGEVEVGYRTIEVSNDE